MFSLSFPGFQLFYGWLPTMSQALCSSMTSPRGPSGGRDAYLFIQWELQDPRMEVLYHIRPYFGGIFPYIGLKNRPYIWNRYLQSIGSWVMAIDLWKPWGFPPCSGQGWHVGKASAAWNRCESFEGAGVWAEKTLITGLEWPSLRGLIPG